MDIETKDLLKQFFPSFAESKGTDDLLKKIQEDPSWNETAEVFRKERIKYMTEQVHDGKWTTMYVRRTGDTMVINWEYREFAKEDPDNIHVLGSITEIDFIPEAHNLASSLIVSTKGHGTVRVKLEEGIYYLIQFVFVNEHTEFNEVAKKDPTNKVDIINFHVAIPLSDDKKAALRDKSAKSKESHEVVRDKLEKFLTVQEAFEEMNRLAIERINARAISPEEKKRQIESFNAKAERLMDEMGM